MKISVNLTLSLLASLNFPIFHFGHSLRNVSIILDIHLRVIPLIERARIRAQGSSGSGKSVVRL